jgi:hypothetical protein
VIVRLLGRRLGGTGISIVLSMFVRFVFLRCGLACREYYEGSYDVKE